MEISELQQWVKETKDELGFPLDQNAATTFAWRLVLRALQSRIGKRDARLYARYGRSPHNEVREQMVRDYWMSDLPRREVACEEVMLDFSVFAGRLRREVILTAESEMHSQHDVAETGDYAWDFYKLLVVQSPFRLFMCRVNGDSKRRDALVATLGAMMRDYEGTHIRAPDEIGVVILPTGTRTSEDIRLLVNGGTAAASMTAQTVSGGGACEEGDI